MEEEVLALGLSFAIAPREVPYDEIIAAAKAISHRLDLPTADALSSAVSRTLQGVKPPKPNLSYQ